MILFEERTLTLMRRSASERERWPNEKMPAHLKYAPFVPKGTYDVYPEYKIYYYILLPILAYVMILLVLQQTGHASMKGVFMLLCALAFVASLLILSIYFTNTRVTVTYEYVTIKRGKEIHAIPVEDIDSVSIESEDTRKEMQRLNSEEFERGRIYGQLIMRKCILMQIWRKAPVRIGTKRPEELESAIRTAMEAEEDENGE